MNYMISIILRAIGITIISACDLQNDSQENTCCVLLIKMQACQINKDAENDFPKKSYDVILGRIFTEDILNETCANQNLIDLVHNFKNGTVKYSNYLSKFRKYFVEILSSECKAIKVFYNAKKFEKLLETNIRIFKTELLSQKANLSFSLKESIENKEIFYDFRSKVQYLFWRSFNDYCNQFESADMYKIINEKEKILYPQYLDHGIAIRYNDSGVWSYDYQTYNERIFKNDLVYDVFGKENYTHLMIDFTYLFIDVLVKNSRVVNTNYKPKMKYINCKEIRKITFEMIESSLKNIFTNAYVHKRLVYDKSSIIFDFITVLEYFNINTDVSQQTYDEIIDLCKFFRTKIKAITEKLEKIHAVKIHMEIVGTFEHYILKIMRHRNTKKLNHLILSISNLEFFNKFFKLLPEYPKFQIQKENRWHFESSLAERIINAYNDPPVLFDFYNNVKMLTENMAQNHTDTNRLKYKRLLNFIGQICIKIEAYKGHLYEKTVINFFHNINEISKPKNFSTKHCSMKIKTLWVPKGDALKEGNEITKNLDKEIFTQPQEGDVKFSEAVSDACVKLVKTKKTKKAKEQLNQELTKKQKKKLRD